MPVQTVLNESVQGLSARTVLRPNASQMIPQNFIKILGENSKGEYVKGQRFFDKTS